MASRPPARNVYARLLPRSLFPLCSVFDAPTRTGSQPSVFGGSLSGAGGQGGGGMGGGMGMGMQQNQQPMGGMGMGMGMSPQQQQMSMGMGMQGNQMNMMGGQQNQQFRR